MIEARTIFYITSFNEIGGVEQWMHYIAKKYGKKKDFIVLYRDGDKAQIERLAKLCRVRIYNDEKVKCENVVFCYHFEIIDNVEAKNYYHFIHGNIEAVKKIYPHMEMLPPPQINKQYSVSEITRQGYLNTYGIDTEVFYNIVVMDEPRKITDEENPFKDKKGLKLITASRLIDAIKGFDYMEIIATELRKANIPFTWVCFSDKPTKEIDDNFIFLKPNLDITPYIKEADYLVQTSRDESYGYSIVESLMLNVPVIVMDIPVLKELGVKDQGYILNFDMSNLDVNKIYNEIPIVKDYQPPMDFDKWETIMGGDLETEYQYDEEYIKQLLNVEWVAKARVVDDDGVKFLGEVVNVASSSRIRQLVSHGLIERVGK
jgi:glycosyltransferase involved in cell wall biosynthesis